MNARPLLLAIALALLLCATNVRADDGAMLGVGGSMRLMKGHPQVRMVSEVVRIKLPEAKVSVSFVFRNDGPATIVTMGFPEKSGGTDVSYRPNTEFKSFSSTIDGRHVTVKRISSDNKDDLDEYTAWWVKKVHFAKGQTRIVEDTYVGQLGYDSSGNRSFCYVLRSGASWKGSIGSIRVICNVSGLNHANLNFSDLKPTRRVGNTVEWYFKNLRPTQNIELYWKPVKKAKR